MSSPTWLSSVANLLVFFRWLAVWVNIVVFSLSIVPLNILYICVFSVTAVAGIYNITVGIVQYRQKKHLAPGVAPVPSITTIALDYLFALVFIAAWILSSFVFAEGFNWPKGRDGWRYYGTTVFEQYSSIGCLVAWHFHLFFAVVSTLIRRKQSQGIDIYAGGASPAANTKESNIDQQT